MFISILITFRRVKAARISQPLVLVSPGNSLPLPFSSSLSLFPSLPLSLHPPISEIVSAYALAPEVAQQQRVASGREGES